MNGLKFLVVLMVTFAVLTETLCLVRYNKYSLHKAFLKVCCGYGSKRDVNISSNRKRAASFLRQKRGLWYECCVQSCSADEVYKSSLREECVNESCSAVEIAEVCH